MLAKLMVLAVIVIGASAFNAYAYTPAGSGAAGVSGYRVANVHYTLAGSAVSAVSFELDQRAAMVSAELAPGRRVDCAPPAGLVVRCVFSPAVPAEVVTSLSVTAAG
jgi:hypothetical protein